MTLPATRYRVQGSPREGRGIVTGVDPQTGGSHDVRLGAVRVADLERHTLIRLDPRSNTVADRIELGSRPTAVALAGGLVWVAVI